MLSLADTHGTGYLGLPSYNLGVLDSRQPERVVVSMQEAIALIFAFTLGMLPGVVFGSLMNSCRTNRRGTAEKNPRAVTLCFVLFGIAPLLVFVHVVYSAVQGIPSPRELAMELGMLAGVAATLSILSRRPGSRTPPSPSNGSADESS
jgi:hypothetical protein